MSIPRFSIIVPVYNAEDYLRICLDSIVGQTFSNIEIILIDDGSTDSSPAICDEYSEKDDRVVVVHKANDGVSEARNDGLRLAKGEYIIFVDNDDYINLRSCEHFHHQLLVYPETEIVACGFRSIDPVKRKQIDNTLRGNEGIYLSGYELLNIHVSQKTRYHPPWVHLYKREFLINNGLFFKKRHYIDDDSYWKPLVLLSAKRCIISNHIYYNWTNRSGSLSHPKSKEEAAKVKIERMQLCLDVEPIFSQISDEKFSARLYDGYILMYVNCIYDLDLYKKSKRHLINTGYLEHNVYSKHIRNKVLKLKTFPYFFGLVRKIEQSYKKLLTQIRWFLNKKR